MADGGSAYRTPDLNPLPVGWNSADPTSWTTGYSGGSGAATGTATGTPSNPAGGRISIETQMGRLAGNIEDEETRRYQGGLSSLVDAYSKSSSVLDQGLDKGLAFSKAADSIGARSKQNMEAMRRSWGARGISPNSGAAGGMMSREQFQREGALIGADRDIEIEDRRLRQVNAAVNFANALSLANYQNSPVSGARLENAQNLFEGQLTREGIKAMERSNARSNETSRFGAMLGFGSNILGSLIPGL